MRVIGVAVAALGVVVAGCGGGSQEADAGVPPARCAGPATGTWRGAGYAITLGEDCSFLQAYSGSTSAPACQSHGTYGGALTAHGQVALEIDLTSGAACGASGSGTCACFQVGRFTCSFDRNTTPVLTLICDGFYAQLQQGP